jgi:hypothetical protein
VSLHVAPDRGIRRWIGCGPPAGFKIDILRKTTFSFDGRTSSTQIVLLADGVEVSTWRDVGIELRLHEKNLWRTAGGLPTNAFARVGVEAVALSPDEPEQAFITRSSTTTASFNDATVTPWMDVKQITLVYGAQLRVSLGFSQGSLAAGGPQTFAISVAIFGRPGIG